MLQGERLILRPAQSGDADRLTEILREPEVAAWWGDHDGKEVIEDPDEVVFVIEAGGEVIGL